MKVAWISSWSRVCGIADYSQSLFPAVRLALAQRGHDLKLFSLDEYPMSKQLIDALEAYGPNVIHIQHEYGIFGGKNPPRYRFPRLVQSLREKFQTVRISATAHTVLASDYRFPTGGRGIRRLIQWPIRTLANRFLLKTLRSVWGPETWGTLDGVIVHSEKQKALVSVAGPRMVEVIPHFVFRAQRLPGAVPREVAAIPDTAPVVLVFGFFTPDKGQDLAIEAFSRLPKSTFLILAGGVRRVEDQSYFDSCLARIGQLGLTDQVKVTGFVEKKSMDGVYARATLVLAPFRETSGSGSLAQAFARGAAVLASDIPLNLEINQREPGALAFFRSEDAEDLAHSMKHLLESPISLQAHRLAARRYAEQCSPENTADSHARFYESLVNLSY